MSITENIVDSDRYVISTEPYYEPVGDEVTLYESAYEVRMPIMIKGPTGCGKSRFIEHMAWKLGRPLITVACNEDRTASDRVGRFYWIKTVPNGRMGHSRPLHVLGRSVIWMKLSKPARILLWLSTR